MKELFSSIFPFWESLKEEDKNMLLRSSQTVKFEAGTNIHDGNECTGIIVVKRGQLRLYMLSEDGKDITLYRLFAGDICILSASCVLDTVSFDVFVDTEDDSEVVVIGGCAYEDLSRRLPEVKIFALENALATFSDVM